MVSDIIDAMYKFQKERGIIKKCIDNAQYAFDCLRSSCPSSSIKVSAVFMSSVDTESELNKLWGGHLVILINDKMVIDPSYETHKAPNTEYYTNVSLLLQKQPLLKDQKELLQTAIRTFLEFRRYADDINSGLIRITDKEYYNAQADFVETLLGG